MISGPWNIYLYGGIFMAEDQRVPNQGRADEDTAHTETVDIGRRAALRNIGALAGAAPAVAVLLTPSASRAWGSGGSPCDGECGSGRGKTPGYKPPFPNRPGGQDTGLLGNGRKKPKRQN